MNEKAKTALKKEYEQLRRNCGISGSDDMNEAFTSLSHPSGRTGQSVQDIGAGTDRWGNTTDVTGKLRPEEALHVAIMRVLAAGSPVNNISFYDEINWNLSQLGFPSKLPLDIKQALLKLVEG
jgi:hypothetical protein